MRLKLLRSLQGAIPNFGRRHCKRPLDSNNCKFCISRQPLVGLPAVKRSMLPVCLSVCQRTFEYWVWWTVFVAFAAWCTTPCKISDICHIFNTRIISGKEKCQNFRLWSGLSVVVIEMRPLKFNWDLNRIFHSSSIKLSTEIC